MTRFIGRARELEALQEAYASNRAELVVVYGRRRLGKTSLLTQFCADKPSVFYPAKLQSNTMQLQDFSAMLKNAGAPLLQIIDSVPTWEAAFSQLGQIPCNGKRLIVIDEFPYMVEGDASIPSILQHLWDHELQKQNVMIVLCGSALAFMEKEVLSEKSPLFGRATRTIRVLPMDFADARLFFFDYSASDQVLAYSVLGGSPYCLQCFDPQVSLKDNVVRQLLSPRGFLWDFPQRAIIQECREPGRYNDIMRTIICGSRRFSEIAAKTVIESANLPRYLRVLSELGFVEREFPADHGIKEEANRQRGLYCLQDNLASFWYQYVWPTWQRSPWEARNSSGRRRLRLSSTKSLRFRSRTFAVNTSGNSTSSTCCHLLPAASTAGGTRTRKLICWRCRCKATSDCSASASFAKADSTSET